MPIANRRHLFILILSGIAALSSCSKFTKLQKSPDVDKKYAAAIAYYEDEQYYKAGLLLEELIPILRGRTDAEKAQLYYAYCHYHQRQLVLSAYYFKRFYETYPRSDNSEEAHYMYVTSLYEDSPYYNLDQTNSYLAIEAVSKFVNKYPQSEYVKQCNTILNVLNAKLELKAYENAKLYYKLRHYNAATEAFENFKEVWPQSGYNEELSFLKIKSQYELAQVSVEDKKEERYSQAITYYQNFIDKYQESAYVDDAQEIYDACLRQLGSFTTI